MKGGTIVNLHGKVIKTYPKERVIKVLCSDKIAYLHLQRKAFKDFGPYFYDNPYVFVEINNNRKLINHVLTYEIESFHRIVQPTNRGREIYYDLDTIKKGVKKLINRQHNKMFIDLEFTMPSYYQTMPHISEIIQYGIVIEDKKGNIVFEDSSLVKPNKLYNLNGRTLKFLSRKRSDFDTAISYKDFYNLLKQCIKEYNPKIYAWGRSDIAMIESSFKINNVKEIDLKSRHINLMQVMKNYYNLHDEMGLFQTYKNLSGLNLEEQQHDALEDAMVLREVFALFKAELNKTK